jgi:hypothetical protein
MLPHVKITDLLMEVDHWTGFTRHFVHLKTTDPAKDPILLVTAILADATNLGLGKWLKRVRAQVSDVYRAWRPQKGCCWP